MASLTGNLVAETYKALLKTIDNDILTASEKQITDGLGGGSNVFIDSQGFLRANKYKVTNGLATQFLKADGSLDSNAYLTSITGAQVITALGFTPVTNQRTLTINGVTYNLTADRSWTVEGTAAVWGNITGTLSNQTDLQNALNAKYNVPAGTISQYIRGDGTLATFPTLPGGLPIGGTSGQILAKIDATDYNTHWIDNFATQTKNEVKLGQTLAKGAAVYVSSANGTNMIVSAASNTSESLSSKTFGLLETGGVTNDLVKCVTFGLLAGLDTSTAQAGDPVWLGVNGALIFGLANKPVAPANLVYIGVVTRVQSNNGEIFVNIQNGFEIEELHDVLIQSKANNQGLFYESSTGLWKNKSIATALGYTPQAQLDGTGFVKASGTTITYDNSTYLTTADAATTYQRLDKMVSTLLPSATEYPNSNAVINALALKANAANPVFTGNMSISGAEPKLFFVDTDNNPDYTVFIDSGIFYIYDQTNGATRFSIGTTGNISAGVGKSITADSFIKDGGTASQFLKADGTIDSNTYVASSALANYLLISTAASTYQRLDKMVSTLLPSSTEYPNSNAVINALALKADAANPVFTGNMTISGAEPKLFFVDTDQNPDYTVFVDSGFFYIYDQTAGATRFQINSSGNISTGVGKSITAGSFVRDGGTASQYLMADGSVSTFAGVTGSGTTNYIPKWTSASGLGNSAITDDGTTIVLGRSTSTLASATEANSITITQPSFTTNQPVKLLNFNWYDEPWSIGNIRSSSSPSNGLGIFATGVEKYRFTSGALVLAAGVNLQFGDNPSIRWSSNNLNLKNTDGSIPVIALRANGSNNQAPRLDIYNAADNAVNITLNGAAGTGVFNSSLVSTDYRYTQDGYLTYNTSAAATSTFTLRNNGTTVLGFNTSNAATFLSSVSASAFNADNGYLLNKNGSDGLSTAFYQQDKLTTTAYATNIQMGANGGIHLWTYNGGWSRKAIFAANSDLYLEFAGNKRWGVDYDFTGAYFFGHSTNGNARALRIISAAADANEGIYFQTGASYLTVTTKMQITDAGNVLIGNPTDVGYKIDINGTGRLQGSATINGTNSCLLVTDGTNNSFIGMASSGGAYGNGTVAGDIVVRGTNGISLAPGSGALTALRIASNGDATFSNIVNAGTFAGNPLNYIDGTNISANTRKYRAIHSRTNNDYATVGLDLSNTQPTNNIYSPIISFSSITSGNVYNCTYAAIWGQKTADEGSWASGDLIFGTANPYGVTQRMRLLANGNLLIGTSTDNGFKLNVNGSANVSGQLNVNAGTGNSAFFYGDAAFDGSNRVYITNNAYIYGRTNLVLTGRLDAGNDGYSFGTNSRNSLVFAVNEGGAQGAIGTPYFGIQLQLVTKGLYIQSKYGNDNGVSGFLYTSDNKLLIRTLTDTGYVLQVNGNVVASSYFESSDFRLKNITKTYDSNDFGAIEFNWKDKRDEKNHWGYVAQDVQKYLPDAVNMGKDGFLSVDYNQAHTYKIAKVEDEIVTLKKRVVELEKQLNLN